MGKKVRGQKKEAKGKKKRERKISFKIPKFLIPKDEPIVPRPFNVIDYAGGILVFFICWAVYLHTLTPTIGFHDSGDMITAAYMLGIPHPTGYPLYCLLGKLWMTLLPIGNIAYRMNLASALCASLACVMGYFIVLKVGGGLSNLVKKRSSEEEVHNIPSLIHSITSSLPLLIPAIVAALMLAFATTFWEQAVIAEKYTLNALFATLLIFILLKWQEAMAEVRGQRTEDRIQKVKGERQREEASYQLPNSPITQSPNKLLYLFAFTLGLSFTHHMQTIYLVPASIFFIVVVYGKKCRQERKLLYSLLTTNYSLLLKMLCLFILPLFLYLYLPIRASSECPYRYGDPKTLDRFIGHISGGEYKTRYTSSSSINKLLNRMREHIITFLPYQFTIYIIWIGIIGIFTFLKRKLLFIFFFLIIITNIFFAIRYNIPNVKDYYILSYLIFSVFIGLGSREVRKVFYHIFTHKIKLTSSIFYIFLLFLPVIPFFKHYHLNNYNNYYLAYDYNINILKYVKEKAIIILKIGRDEITFPIAYIQWVENQRSEIALINRARLSDDWWVDLIKRNYPIFNFPFKKKKRKVIKDANAVEMIRMERLNNIVINNFNKFPIYTHDIEIFSNYQLIPGGILYRILKKGVSKEQMWREFIISKPNFNLRNIDGGKICGRFPFKKVEKVIIHNYAEVYCEEGGFYHYMEMDDKAIISLKKALQIDPPNEDAHFLLKTILKKEKNKNEVI